MVKTKSKKTAKAKKKRYEKRLRTTKLKTLSQVAGLVGQFIQNQPPLYSKIMGGTGGSGSLGGGPLINSGGTQYINQIGGGGSHQGANISALQQAALNPVNTQRVPSLTQHSGGGPPTWAAYMKSMNMRQTTNVSTWGWTTTGTTTSMFNTFDTADPFDTQFTANMSTNNVTTTKVIYATTNFPTVLQNATLFQSPEDAYCGTVRHIKLNDKADCVVELPNGILVEVREDGSYAVGGEVFGKHGEIRVHKDKVSTVILPDGAVIHVENGNYRIEDKDAKVIYRANHIREFNRYINASDLVEEFIADSGKLGINQVDFFKIPIEVFIKWLINRAALADGEEPPIKADDLANTPTLRQISQPQCLFCQAPLALECVRAGINFCSGAHMDAHRQAIEPPKLMPPTEQPIGSVTEALDALVAV